MGIRTILLAAAGVLLGATPGAGAGDRERPFPVERTTILREEKIVYTVEGRQTIPEGIEITCLKDVHVKGVGDGAVIEVEGALKVHGVGTREVIFENVTIELAPNFKDVQMDMCIFREGAQVRTPKDVAVDGKLFLELNEFRGGSTIDVTFASGSVDIASLCSDAPVRVTAVDPEDGPPNKVKVTVRGCTQQNEHLGLRGGLIITGAHDATVRINRLGGDLCSFRDCRTLMFDGNKVDAKTLEFVQSGEGTFRRSKFLKCDVYSDTVKFHSAQTEKKDPDRITVDRWWFRGETNPREILGKIVLDGTDDETNAARVRLVKPGERPLELAGKWDR